MRSVGSLCACCGVKTVKKMITSSQEKLVQEYAKPQYDSEVKSFPAGLCPTCKANLYFCKKDVDWEWSNKADPRIKWDKFHLNTERYKDKLWSVERRPFMFGYRHIFTPP